MCDANLLRRSDVAGGKTLKLPMISTITALCSKAQTPPPPTPPFAKPTNGAYQGSVVRSFEILKNHGFRLFEKLYKKKDPRLVKNRRFFCWLFDFSKI
jgi:hypothetical protein